MSRTEWTELVAHWVLVLGNAVVVVHMLYAVLLVACAVKLVYTPVEEPVDTCGLLGALVDVGGANVTSAPRLQQADQRHLSLVVVQ